MPDRQRSSPKTASAQVPVNHVLQPVAEPSCSCGSRFPVDGLVEFASTSESSFAHYQLVYAEEHRDADVQYLTLTDEEYDAMFPPEEEE